MDLPASLSLCSFLINYFRYCYFTDFITMSISFVKAEVVFRHTPHKNGQHKNQIHTHQILFCIENFFFYSSSSSSVHSFEMR